MIFARLLVLLPCSSLEDLRLDRNAEEAEELLSAWSALWHPSLIASTQTMPGWFPATEPPQEPAKSLIILPECCQPLLPEAWLDQAEASGAVVLRKLKHRSEMVGAALQSLAGGPSTIDADLVADFLALGFCHFVVKLLTRKHHYSSTLDEDALATVVLAAAVAAVQGDVALPGRSSIRPSIGSTKPESIYIRSIRA